MDKPAGLHLQIGVAQETVPVHAARNDEVFCQSEGCSAALESVAQVEGVIRQMTDAPLDLPAREDATIGIVAALTALEVELPSVALLRVKISETVAPESASVGNAAVVVSLSRRKGRFLIYALVREIGSAIKNGRALDNDLLRIVGTICIRHLLNGYQPSPGSIAHVRAGLLYPTANVAQTWSMTSRARAANKARQGLLDALESNSKGAEEFGLSGTPIRPQKAASPVDVFNLAFRRRVENLIDFATLDAVTGAGGYDTLSKAGFLYAGRQILDKAISGDCGAVVVGLEVVTHLPSECVLLLPLQRGETAPAGALAWLDLQDGTYKHVLYRLHEHGAKPEIGKEALHEETTQIVSIYLSPPFHRLLLEMDQGTGRKATNVNGLTGPAGHHPRAAVVEGAGYRITARRMQESVPTLLLQEGCHRWPVALATNSHFLVTRGRRAYGACRSDSIHKVVDRAYELLGWPTPTGPKKSDLVGTPTVPKGEAISRGLNFLSNRADSTDPTMDSFESVCAVLRVHAEWLAMLEALAFALRRWVIYQLKVRQIIAGDVVKFNDKDIHPHQGPGIPAMRILRESVSGWMTLCQEAVGLLRGLADPESSKLAERLEQCLLDDGSDLGILTVDALGNLKPVGYRTWSEALPDNIRLRPNFARQYWPLKLMDCEVEQLVIDLLMRHQLDRIPPGSSCSLKTLNRSMAILGTAMERVLSSLKLSTPRMLKRDRNGQ